MPLTDRYVPAVNGDSGDSVAANMEKDKNFVHFRRPFLNEHDQPCVIVNTGEWTVEKGERKPIRRRHRVIDLLNAGHQVPLFVLNATSMRKEDWIKLDTEVQKVYRQDLTIVADLQARVPYGGFNGWNKMTLEYEVMSDAHEAIVDMDGLSEGRGDYPLFKLRSLPLPVTHSDFFYGDRRLSISRNSGTGLDVFSGEMASRRVAEMVEKTTIGVETGVSYGTRASGFLAHDLTSTVFGATNYTNINLKTNFTAPTTGGWVANTSYNEVLAALDTLLNDNVKGPFMLYHSTDWTQYMNAVFSVSGGNHPGETLRSMLLKNPDILDVKRLAYLTSTFTLVFIAMRSDVVQFVNGMDVTTLQWETRGGMQKNFKVMVVQAPLFRSDYTGQCGILKGTTA